MACSWWSIPRNKAQTRLSTNCTSRGFKSTCNHVQKGNLWPADCTIHRSKVETVPTPFPSITRVMKKSIILSLILFISGMSVAFSQNDPSAVIAEVTENVHYKLLRGNLEKSVNGGKTWKVIQNELPFYNHLAMQWIDEDNGYLLGDDGTFAYAANVMRTFDGGKTWNTFYAEGLTYTAMNLEKVEIISDEHHFVALGFVEYGLGLKEKEVPAFYYATSSNGGKSFKLGSIKLPKDVRLEKTNSTLALNADGTGTLSGEGLSYQTKDFGKTWALMAVEGKTEDHSKQKRRNRRHNNC